MTPQEILLNTILTQLDNNIFLLSSITTSPQGQALAQLTEEYSRNAKAIIKTVN